MNRHFFITSKLDSDVITIKARPGKGGARIVAQPKSRVVAANQRWEIIYSGVPPYFFIRSAVRGARLVDSGVEGGIERELWRLAPSPVDGYYFIQNKASGNVIDIQGAQTADGTPIITYPQKTSGITNQLWALERA